MILYYVYFLYCYNYLTSIFDKKNIAATPKSVRYHCCVVTVTLWVYEAEELKASMTFSLSVASRPSVRLFSTSHQEPLDKCPVKLNKDDVLLILYKCHCISARSAHRWIQGSTKKVTGDPPPFLKKNLQAFRRVYIKMS